MEYFRSGSESKIAIIYLTETGGNCVAHKTIHEENTLFNGDNLEIRNSTHTKLFTRMTMVLLEFLVSQNRYWHNF